MQVAVVGAGYVGLVTAACLAKMGNQVRCVDIDRERIARIQRGVLPFHETGLDEVVHDEVESGRLRFDAAPEGIRGSDVAMIAVGTLDGTGAWTAETVRAAARAVAEDPLAPRMIVIRSTLLPPAAGEIERELRAVAPSVEVALNPEFTREGSAVTDFLVPDRVVIGAAAPNGAAATFLRRLYAPLDCPVVVTDVVTAATIKVASNVFLATKIAFANELSRLAAATGADISAVVDGMGLDSRIGRRFLSPGPGFGGSCLPSQARALPEVAASLGVRTPLMEAVARANDEQTAWVVRMVEDALGRPVADASIALLGLTFKAHTDDVRESPSLGVAAQLSSDGANLAVYDPTGSERALRSLAAQRVAARAATNAVDACRGADVVVVLTEWPEFRELDWDAVCAVMRGAAAVDTRDVVDIDRAAAAGVEVIKLGRHAAHGVPRTGDGARQPGEDRRSSEAEPAYADAGAR